MKAQLAYQWIKKQGAPTYVFFHGFMGSSKDWEKVVDCLKEHLSCLLIDLPGHGNSRLENSKAYTMEGCAQLVLALLDHLGVEGPTLLGYSMGGRLALYMGLRYPEYFTSLFVESATPGLKDLSERRERRRKDHVLADRLETEDYESFLDWWYKSRIFSSLAEDKTRLASVKERRKSNRLYGSHLAKSLRFMGQGMQEPLWEDLKNLSIPLCFLVGEKDHKYVKVAEEARHLNEQITVQLVKRAGHNIHEENLAGFCQSILSREKRHEPISLG